MFPQSRYQSVALSIGPTRMCIDLTINTSTYLFHSNSDGLTIERHGNHGRDNPGVPTEQPPDTRWTTTGHPRDYNGIATEQPRDNHGTTTEQAQDNRGTTTGRPRDNNGTTTGHRSNYLSVSLPFYRYHYQSVGRPHGRSHTLYIDLAIIRAIGLTIYRSRIHLSISVTINLSISLFR